MQANADGRHPSFFDYDDKYHNKKSTKITGILCMINVIPDMVLWNKPQKRTRIVI